MTKSLTVQSAIEKADCLPADIRAAARFKFWRRQRRNPIIPDQFKAADSVLRELIGCIDRKAPRAFVFPTQQTIGGDVRKSEKWVRSCLSWLNDAGYVTVKRHCHGKRNGYLIHPVFFDFNVWPAATFCALTELPPWPSSPELTSCEAQSAASHSPEVTSAGSPEVTSDRPPRLYPMGRRPLPPLGGAAPPGPPAFDGVLEEAPY
jgi:hypothetical protein